jgi:hypothetical protein
MNHIICDSLGDAQSLGVMPQRGNRNIAAAERPICAVQAIRTMRELALVEPMISRANHGGGRRLTRRGETLSATLPPSFVWP